MMEDRRPLAVTSFASGQLTINFDATGEDMTLTNNGTNISLASSAAITGAGATFSASSVNRIVFADPSNLTGQVLRFATGSQPLTLSAGLLGTGVEVVTFGSQITAAGTSSIDVTAGSSIQVRSNLTSGTGGLTLAGGGLVGTNQTGIDIESGAVLTATGSGSVTLQGTAGPNVGTSNFGIHVRDNSQITSGGGPVNILAIGNTSDPALRLTSGGSIASGLNASVTITTDSLSIDGTPIGSVNSGTGQTTIQTRTSSTRINLGGSDVFTGSPLTLGITTSELDRVTAGILQIGNASSGPLTLSADITRSTSTNIRLLSGSEITSAASFGSINTAGGTLVYDAGAQGIQPIRSGIDAVASNVQFAAGETLAISINGSTVDTQFDQLRVTGAVNLTGSNLLLTSGFSGATGNESFTLVDATTGISGQFANYAQGAPVSIGIRTFHLHYNTNSVQLLRNGPPSDLSLSSTTVDENLMANSLVGTFASTDPDVGNSFTYSLVAGPGSNDNTNFTIVGNALRTNTAFDFETKSSYSIRVRSTDQSGLFVDKALTISITDRFEAPRGIAYLVEESNPSGGLNNAVSPALGASISQMQDIQGVLYFTANDGANGDELWRINSQGIAELVEDSFPGGGIGPGPASSSPVSLTNVNGTLYFLANDGLNGLELWRINGQGSAEMVEDSVAGGGISPGLGSIDPQYANLTNVNGALFFQANDGINGNELWRISASGMAEMIEDSVPSGGIRPTSGSSNPRNLTNVAGTLFFSAQDGSNGYELWMINSQGSAVIVEDSVPGGGIRSGSAGSSPRVLSNMNGTLFFEATDGTNGYELWRVNGQGVAEMIEDTVPGGGIRPGNGGSSPRDLTNVNGLVFFRATDGTNGSELWRINSQGLAEMVEDIAPGGGINPASGSSNPRYLSNVNGTLFFRADDGTNGSELWKLNTQGIAEIVEDNVPGGGISPASGASAPINLTNVNGTLFFRASDGTNGYELWRINSQGFAEMIEDIIPGGGIFPASGGSNPRFLTNVSGTLFFIASDATNGNELWRINGQGIAEMVEDSISGGGIIPVNDYPRLLTNANGTLFFLANDGLNGEELWRVNPTGIAQLVNDGFGLGGIAEGSGGSMPGNFTNVNGSLYFTATTGELGTRLWMRQGNLQPVLVEGAGSLIGSSITNLTNVNGRLFFTANDGTNGTELWRVNNQGIAEIVEDSVAGGGINSGSDSSIPRYLTNVNGILFFQANDGTNGIELWRIDGIGIAEMVEDGEAGGGINASSGSSVPSHLTNVNGSLFFRATSGSNSEELWRINSQGTAEMIEDSVPGGGINPEWNSGSQPQYMTSVNGTVYFQALDGTNGWELWRINSQGVAEMVEDSVPGGGIRSGSSGSYPQYLNNVNGTLFFRANDGVNGRELWRINSQGVAEMVEDSVAGGGVFPSVAALGPLFLTNVAGMLYFQANDGTNGTELWRVNSQGIAEMVEDNTAGGGLNSFGDSSPRYLTNVNGTLFFRASHQSSGHELWRVNGQGVAEVVEDSIPGGGIRPGYPGSEPRNLTNVGGNLFFRANDGANGYELWRVNNLGVATMVEDSFAGGGFNAGASGSNPSQLFELGGILYFSADAGPSSGLELWALELNFDPTDITLANTSIDENSGPNAIVGILGSVDANAGDTFTYTLVSGTGSTGNASFNISGATLRATSSFDFEFQNSYSVRIRTMDQGGQWFERAFTVLVSNVNETPTNISLTAQSIAENRPSGTVVGTLSTSDPDLGNTHTYTLVDSATFPGNAQFTISGNELRTAASFNFESTTSYTIRVRSTDNTNLSFEKTFVITVIDANEPPTITINNIASPLPENENTSSNILVANIGITDTDGGTNTLSLSGTDASSFEIVNGTQLRLQAGVTLDFETKPSYVVIIQSDDTTIAGSPDATATYTLSIGNVNEPPTNVALSN